MATSVEYTTSSLDPQYTYSDPSTMNMQANNHFVPEGSDETLDSMPQKRKEAPSKSSTKPNKKARKSGEGKNATTPNGDGEEGETSKPKRVRTGCLTCRERHLKCDEAWPNCLNCRKSNRQCKRGIKLNFIDIWVDQPPHIVTAFGTERWRVEFLDESRDIASEYIGSTHKYPPLEQEPSAGINHDQQQLMSFNMADTMQAAAPNMAYTHLQQQEMLAAMQYHAQANNVFDETAGQMGQSMPFYTNAAPAQVPNSDASVHSAFAPAPTMQSTTHTSTSSVTADDLNEKRDFLNTAEETLFMQVFVEEVGLWMDSMDPLKHFSRLLPFHALGEPMLLNAFLACGAKHLTLVNPAYSEEKALNHYDTATRYLLKNLQNPNRDTVICATTAVILNVYEVMSERPTQRMNHIAGARALIKECGWTARASGIGAACFWLNVGLEVMSCLHFNWQVAWDPDDWGIDMTLTREMHNGMEESWTHKMLYIIGKICNLRATAPRDVLQDPAAQQARLQHRYNEWVRLKAMADTWNDCVPRTMHPIAYVYPTNTASKSAFPEIWLIKRTTIVARLFYHTAMLLLAQIHPYLRVHENKEMAEMQQQHAQMTCGIVAHVKDRGVASVAIRSLAHAAEVLTDRRQQEEVIEIFQKINKETGWRIGFVYSELKDKWGWNEGLLPHQYAQTHEAATKAKGSQDVQHQQHAQAANMQMQQSFDFNSQQHSANSTMMHLTSPAQSLNSNASPPAPATSAPAPRPRLPSGIPNPMYAKADFTLPQHPYQSYYVAPSAGYGNVQNGTNAWWNG